VVLALPWLKTVTFRLFGYHGSTRFTIYPDTWIRDLPLLEIGEGAYLSNNATVSPNICLNDGSILVKPIRIGAESLIGHAARVGPGVRIGERSEVGVATALAIHVVVGDDVRIGHCCDIDRGVHVANRVRIAEANSVGANSSLGESARTPFGLTVPARVTIAGGRELLVLAESQGVNRSRRDAAVTPPPMSVSCGP
jgi:UDP-3-O-[3-hydroxymyristoyl] glucosamine N-acyltransferase